MKNFLFLLLLLFLPRISWAALALTCPPTQLRIWTEGAGYACVSQFPTAISDCIICQSQSQSLAQQPNMNWFSTFPANLYQPRPLPWWAYQGNLHYPNLQYPGAWAYPGINAQYYPGQGEIFAAKPNVYIESIHPEKKFSFSFPEKKELNFLVTTPLLDEKNSWKGKVKGDQFEMDYVVYDYLFYDIRLPKDKMQFERGVCATREETIKWMLKDLKEMRYPAISLQDFEEHWTVKIPQEYPIYCIYPQYNQQLDEALPVTIGLEHTNFVRSLYILVPYKEAPDPDEPQEIPLPLSSSEEIRPKVVIKHENMFKEWGVAFFGK